MGTWGSLYDIGQFHILFVFSGDSKPLNQKFISQSLAEDHDLLVWDNELLCGEECRVSCNQPVRRLTILI